MAAVIRTRPYKDFLTPALHRRFTNAAFVAVLACWLESAWISGSSLFWRLWPFGFTGIRALLLFIPCLSVFIIRVANLHFGSRNTTSTSETLTNLVKSVNLWHTLAWYLFSAWLFGEIYIWSRAEQANLAWVDYGRPDERPRLNENPIQLRCFMVVLAGCQTWMHFQSEYDRIEEMSKRQIVDVRSRLPRPLQRMFADRATMLGNLLHLAVLSMLFAFVSYYAFMRSIAWNWAYPIGRTLFHELPRHAKPSGIIHVTTQARSLIAAQLQLAMLWEISNKAFSVSVSEPPLKRDQPLTDEIKDPQGNLLSPSQTPNGSLISGLKSKKELVKSFALWELWEICSSFEGRRKTIFIEGERKEDSTWAKVCLSCLIEVEAIKERIATFQQSEQTRKEQGSEKSAKKPTESVTLQQQEPPVGLPRIANQVVQDREVWQRQSGGVIQTAGDIARKVGTSPGPRPNWNRPVNAVIGYGESYLTPEQRQRFSSEGLQKDADSVLLQLMKSPLGVPFRKAFARRMCAVIFGVPYSRKLNIINAVRSLTKLAICSLQDDSYGRAASDVATIVRTYTSTITGIENFVAASSPHWTDVEFTVGDREVEEVAEVLRVLRECLGEIVVSFAEYAGAIGLAPRELREAKEAAGRVKEMVKI